MRWFTSLSHQRKNEIFGFLLVVLALFVGLSLATHARGDDEWIRAGRDAVWVDTYQPRNLAGTIGALLSSGLYEWFGLSAYFLTFLIGAVGVRLFLTAKPRKPVSLTGGLLAWVFVLGVLIDLRAAGSAADWTGGVATVSGWLGRQIAVSIANLLGVVGGTLILGSLLLGAVLLVIPWKQIGRAHV